MLICIMIVCFFLLGDELYKSYKKKYKDIADLIKILEILHMELGFGLYTLSEVFFKLGEKKDFRLWEFFEELGKNLEKNESKFLEEIVNENVYLVKEKTFLGEKELEELKNLILNLGKSDFYSQERIIELAIENLKKMQEEAFLEVSTKGILYKKISLIMGFLLAIILL